MRIKNTLHSIYGLFLFITICSFGNKGAQAQCVADFTHTSPCYYSTFYIDLSTAGPGHTIISWSWDFGDGGTSALQNPIHTYAAPGTYPVTLIIETDLGCSATVTSDVFIHEQPDADFTSDTACAGTPTQFTDLTNPGNGNTIVSWWWDFSDGYTSTTQNPTHIYAVSGTYSVVVVIVADCGCVDTVVRDVVVDAITQIETNEGNDAILRIYPNPFTASTTIEYELKNSGTASITIVNYLGNIVESISIKNSQPYIWDASEMPEGIYFIQVKEEEKVITRRVVKR